MEAPIVCNCNNYGMIDYGMPIRPNQTDYRTSTYRGLRHIPQVAQDFYGFKLDPFKGTFVDCRYDIYRTQNKISHDFKLAKPGEKPNFPPRVDKNNYLRNFKEICYKNPPMPRHHYVSEHADQYVLKRSEPFREIPGVIERTTCHMPIAGKAEQPRLKTEEAGIVKHLDIYMTTNRNSYIPYSTAEMEKAKKHAVTYWETKTDPEVLMCNIKKPLNDEIRFPRAILDRVQPRLVYRVPFKGITSEYQGNYIPPTKSCFYTRIYRSDVKFDDALSNANMSQTLAAPNMYCTENCHYGIGRAVCASVPSRYEKKVKMHPICGDNY